MSIRWSLLSGWQPSKVLKKTSHNHDAKQNKAQNCVHISGHALHISLQWRHNGRDSSSDHQPHDCLLNHLFKAQIKENIKASRHWPLWREFTGDRWILRTQGHHDFTSVWSTLPFKKVYIHRITFGWDQILGSILSSTLGCHANDIELPLRTYHALCGHVKGNWPKKLPHSDVIMCAMGSQITSLTIVYSTVYSGANQRKH